MATTFTGIRTSGIEDGIRTEGRNCRTVCVLLGYFLCALYARPSYVLRVILYVLEARLLYVLHARHFVCAVSACAVIAPFVCAVCASFLMCVLHARHLHVLHALPLNVLSARRLRRFNGLNFLFPLLVCFAHMRFCCCRFVARCCGVVFCMRCMTVDTGTASSTRSPRWPTCSTCPTPASSTARTCRYTRVLRPFQPKSACVLQIYLYRTYKAPACPAFGRRRALQRI